MIEFLFNFGFKAFFIIFGLILIAYIGILLTTGVAILLGNSEAKRLAESDTKASIQVKKIPERTLRDEISIKRILKLLGIVLGIAIGIVILSYLYSTLTSY